MVQSRVLLALLSYIEPLPRKKSNVTNTFQWTSSQLEEIQLHALAALSILLPHLLNEYFEYHIGTQLLIFYEWTISISKIEGREFEKLRLLCLCRWISKSRT